MLDIDAGRVFGIDASHVLGVVALRRKRIGAECVNTHRAHAGLHDTGRMMGIDAGRVLSTDVSCMKGVDSSHVLGIVASCRYRRKAHGGCRCIAHEGLRCRAHAGQRRIVPNLLSTETTGVPNL